MGARTRGLANNVLTSGKLDATDAIDGVIAADNIANASLTSATTYGSVTGGVPAVSSDPPSPSEGDIWYNTTTGKIRFRSQIGAWATSNNMNTGRVDGAAAGASNSSALAFGGEVAPPTGKTESYDGTSWTEVADMNTARYGQGGAGTQTAALTFGGTPPETGATESWNGSSWTEVNDLNDARQLGGSNGTQTSALLYGGTPTPGGTANTESWNGSSWTEVNNLNTARWRLSGIGSDNTAAIAISGRNASWQAAVESWNGSSWTEVNDVNTAVIGSGSAGNELLGLKFGGETPAPAQQTATEDWNGTSWTEVADLSEARDRPFGNGSNTSALCSGGYPGSGTSPSWNATEEWSLADTTFDVG